MEEIFIKELTGLGIAGIVGFSLFKVMLDYFKNSLEENNKDKLYYREQIEKTQKLFEENLKEDRKTYVESIKEVSGAISLLSNRVQNVEEDISEIKDELKRL